MARQLGRRALPWCCSARSRKKGEAAPGNSAVKVGLCKFLKPTSLTADHAAASAVSEKKFDGWIF